jgi:hypothetical protein
MHLYPHLPSSDRSPPGRLHRWAETRGRRQEPKAMLNLYDYLLEVLYLKKERKENDRSWALV